MLDPADILPTRLKPCLAEVLRTCVHPPTLLLRVEHILVRVLSGNCRNTPPSPDHPLNHGQDLRLENGSEIDLKTPSLRCLCLIVSDGHLQIQAVLAKELHTKELLESQRGDLIEVKKFQIRSAPRINGQGRVVYLGIQSCEWAGRGKVTDPELDFEGGFIREEAHISPQNPQWKEQKRSNFHAPAFGHGKRGLSADHGGHSFTKRGLGEKRLRQQRIKREDSDDEDDFFEVMPVSQFQIDRRRENLHQIAKKAATNIPSRPKPTAHGRIESDRGPITTPASLKVISQMEMRTGDGKKIPSLLPEPRPEQQSLSATPLEAQPSSVLKCAPLHALSSLLSPPTPLPSRNYACTVFAIITWVSTSIIHKANTPFPPKRHIKIHDQSIRRRQAGVTVAVFIDAKNFFPRVGTVALFRDVVMHRWEDDIILNKYASPKPGHEDDQVAEEWFISDEKRLEEMGFDVAGMRAWWAEKRREKKGEN
ncbi:uncharacterized protein Z518_08521 [Rhinocladiella mackenziei CBS 650.93]|uniref:Uncharacterized protein n=1 Tax=Rhinocladiella mackenziei CBS 650.93 TaxID=1442369 RepID=A0A0D2J144_9EURO|nr:uncharacterized protein Z518_08521 [Rhinocladiella mackenziei CBS 650.93]KIX02580.1 hypothetical protein Z518_08521 [Rhinocladiella mackenziei CBS 650.93]